MPRVLSAYILREITVPFALCLAILTATALLSKAIKIVELMLTHGAGPSFIFWFIVSVTPSFLIYTIPVSFLAAVMIAFTRLSSDHEITAMKASGLSLATIMRPVGAIAVGAFAIAFVFTAYIFPWGNLSLKSLLYEVGRTSFTAAIEEKTFYDRFEGAVLYVDHYAREKGVMEGVFISKDESGGGKTIFFAPSGVVAPSTTGESVYFRLYDGTIHRKSEDDPGSYHLADFSTYTLELLLAGAGPPSEGIAGRHNRELYPGELMERINRMEARGRDTAPYVIDLHKRFALPASVFVFTILGLPLGVQRVRTARFAGFSTALAVVLAYYLASTVFEALGENGVLGPLTAVWGSDVLFLAAGVYVFYMATADRPLNPVELIRRARARREREDGE